MAEFTPEQMAEIARLTAEVTEMQNTLRRGKEERAEAARLAAEDPIDRLIAVGRGDRLGEIDQVLADMAEEGRATRARATAADHVALEVQAPGLARLIERHDTFLARWSAAPTADDIEQARQDAADLRPPPTPGHLH